MKAVNGTLMKSAAVLTAKGEESNPNQDGSQNECGNTICPSDPEHSLADEPKQHDGCLIHAEVGLFCIRQHGMAVKSLSNATFRAREERHQDDGCRCDRNSPSADCGMLVTI